MIEIINIFVGAMMAAWLMVNALGPGEHPPPPEQPADQAETSDHDR